MVASRLALVALLAAPADWLSKVPAALHARKNPIVADKTNIAAGDRLYTKYCAGCHGEDARGSQKIPGLTSARLRKASDGDLFWVLSNGIPGTIMLPWTSITEQQRWQVIRYIRTLK